MIRKEARVSPPGGGSGGALLAAAGLSFAMVQLALGLPGLGLPQRWMDQALFVAALWLGLSVASALLRAKGFALLLFALLRLVAYEILSYPLGARGSVTLSLLCALVAETVMALPFPADVILSSTFVAVSLLRPSGASAWNNPVPRSDFADSAAFSFLPLMLILLLRLYKAAQRKAADQQELIGRLKRSGLDLIDTNIALQEKIVTQEARLLEMERSRISRELHDTIGYTLMNILAMQKAAASLFWKNPERAREFIDKTMEQSERGLQDTRAAIGSLRDRGRREATIAEVVTRLAKAFENTHIRISADLNNSAPSYGPRVDEALGRFVQEAITNAIKHGNADEIFIGFWRQPEGLTVSIRDNGSGVEGAAVPAEGIGIRGMRERFGELGGSIAMGNAFGGFRISAFVPAEACRDWA